MSIYIDKSERYVFIDSGSQRGSDSVWIPSSYVYSKAIKVPVVINPIKPHSGWHTVIHPASIKYMKHECPYWLLYGKYLYGHFREDGLSWWCYTSHPESIQKCLDTWHEWNQSNIRCVYYYHILTELNSDLQKEHIKDFSLYERLYEEHYLWTKKLHEEKEAFYKKMEQIRIDYKRKSDLEFQYLIEKERTNNDWRKPDTRRRKRSKERKIKKPLSTK